MHRPALSYLLSDLRRNISVPIRDGGNPSPSGEARSSKSPKGTSYPPTEVGGFKNEAGALNRIQFDAPAVTPRLEAGGCLVSRAGKRSSMATMNGSARPATSVTGILDSVSDVIEGGRVAPRPNPEVVARAKRRTYTGEYKQEILAEADAARGSG